jgi:CDP-diacylglycerol--glycerol-3-phosphate 3-phosphatidyltransferase
VKSLANYISIARMVLAFTLAFVKPLSIVFIAIYIICGISDVLDGYIARKTDTISKLGGKLDTIADFLMIMVLMIILFPIINPEVQIILWIVIIAIVKAVSVTIVFVKYKTFEILHTYGNKITGVLIFSLTPLLSFVQADMLVYIICMVASVSAIEELFIHLSSDELQINRKSIFRK